MQRVRAQGECASAVWRVCRRDRARDALLVRNGVPVRLVQGHAIYLMSQIYFLQTTRIRNVPLYN